ASRFRGCSMSGFMCVGQRVRWSIKWRVVAMTVSVVLLAAHSLRAESPPAAKVIAKKSAPAATDVRDGEVLANTEQQNRLISELIRATVEAELRSARNHT